MERLYAVNVCGEYSSCESLRQTDCVWMLRDTSDSSSRRSGLSARPKSPYLRQLYTYMSFESIVGSIMHILYVKKADIEPLGSSRLSMGFA